MSASNKKPHLVVFSGAGMSAESGLKTFRDNNGLWENHDVAKVATPKAWEEDKELVLRFYNQRKKQLFKAQPNNAHHLVYKLEKDYKVTVITQNVDDLHERAGSSNVVHLHGELKKARSERHPELIYDLGKEDIKLGDVCEKGHQLRPNIVWFGEEVPMIDKATQLVSTADILIVIGSSLNVYPAAGIIHFTPKNAKCFLIDPKIPDYDFPPHWNLLKTTAGEGLEAISNQLSQDRNS